MSAQAVKFKYENQRDGIAAKMAQISLLSTQLDEGKHTFADESISTVANHRGNLQPLTMVLQHIS